MFTVRRLLDRPIITPDLHPSLGPNIQGPSLIRAPDWLPNRLGTYYLYFADHKGSYIRLAFADHLEGPWTIRPQGSLQLAQSGFPTEPPYASPEQIDALAALAQRNGISIAHDWAAEVTTPHIASPDVHVDHVRRRIVMYYHGLEGVAHQVTRVATSLDGLNFTATPEILGKSYFRVIRHGAWSYAIAMPGQFHRSADGLTGFAPGPLLFNPKMRHAALLKRDDTLFVFWTQVGDVPEHIMLSRIDISGDWMGWQDQPTREILRPERPWEGAGAPLVPSVRSTAYGLVNQLRDPAIFEEDGRIYLLYAVGGESGIAIAELFWDQRV